MNDRERFVASVLGEPVDRPPYWLFWGPWKTTWQRWAQEVQSGAASEGHRFPAGADEHLIFYESFRASFEPDQPPRAIPVNCGPCPRIEEEIIEETDEFIIHIDSWGIKRRDFKHRESMSEFIQFPVKEREDWEQFKADRLDPDHPDRLRLCPRDNPNLSNLTGALREKSRTGVEARTR